jgi:hypothetical protein
MLIGRGSITGRGNVDSTMTWDPPQPARDVAVTIPSQRSLDASKGSRDMN